VNKKSDLLVHLDTLGHRPSSMIIGLGAAVWDLQSEDEPQDFFYQSISCQSNVLLGRQLSEETLDWWREEARYHDPFKEPMADLPSAIRDFVGFFRSMCVPECRIWFWCPHQSAILLSAMDRVGVMEPWKYWKVHDVRSWSRTAYLAKFGHTMPSPSGDSPRDQLYNRVLAMNGVRATKREFMGDLPDLALENHDHDAPGTAQHAR
jgi:hypothetical protein